MKQAVILCGNATTPSFDDVLIGVDGAAVVNVCDLWVCPDLALLRELIPAVAGSPRLLTVPETAAQLRVGQWRADVLKDPDFWKQYDADRIGWSRHGSTIAVAYAAHLGCGVISVLGLDPTPPAERETLDILAGHLKRTAGVHAQA